MKNQLATRGHGVDKMPKGAAQPIQTPNNDGIAWSGKGDSFLQSFPLCLAATGSIRKDFLAATLFQCIELQLRVCSWVETLAYPISIGLGRAFRRWQAACVSSALFAGNGDQGLLYT